MQVNRKPDFFLKKVYIQWVLRADKNPDEQNGPLPGQQGDRCKRPNNLEMIQGFPNLNGFP
jgi:hypothetical protein